MKKKQNFFLKSSSGGKRENQAEDLTAGTGQRQMTWAGTHWEKVKMQLFTKSPVWKHVTINNIHVLLLLLEQGGGGAGADAGQYQEEVGNSQHEIS